MRNVGVLPIPVRVTGSLTAMSIAVTSISAALMVAPNVGVAAGAGAPSGGGETSTQSAPHQQKKSHAKKNRSSLAADPNHAVTWSYYGMWQAEQGNLLKAKDDLEKVRLICGTTCEPYKMLTDVIEGTQTY